MSGAERASWEELEAENRRLREQLERALREIERLQRAREEALRAGKRQAAPHSRGEPKQNPKKPGRKAGSHYGRQTCRTMPPRIDERIPAPVPERCDRCGGEVVGERIEPQYQEEIVRRTIVRRFDVEMGRCRCCGSRVHGRHRWQTSDALGAATVQSGPEALSLAAHLNKQMGLSLGHTAQVLALGLDFQVRRGGIYRAWARMAKQAAPSYQGLVVAARQSLVNGVDETGWRVGGRLQWMWVWVSEQVTVYAVLAGRGFPEAASVLGPE